MFTSPLSGPSSARKYVASRSEERRNRRARRACYKVTEHKKSLMN